MVDGFANGNDISGTGEFSDRWNFFGNPSDFKPTPSGIPFFFSGTPGPNDNPAAFAIPAPGRVGNLGRNALHGPSLSQFDLTAQKRFQIHEQINVEFRAEIYNLFNRANFANAPVQLNQSLGTGTNQLQPDVPFTAAAAGGAFGVFSSTVEKAVGLGTSRQVQLSLRLNF